MPELAKAFAGIQWLWVVKTSIILSVVFVIADRWRRTRPALLSDFAITIALAVILFTLLRWYHASAGAIEIVVAFCIAQIVRAVGTAILDRLLKRVDVSDSM